MRMLLHVTIPNKPFNEAVREGTAGAIMGRILEETKPEAVYFTEENGSRCALLVVDVDNPSRVPVLAEPWYLNFNASCEFRIVMTPDDLKNAQLDELGKKWK